MKKKPAYVKIIYSCVTGAPVWIHFGKSENAWRFAYRRACKKEVRRVRMWSKHVARRAANVAKLLSRCTESIPIDAELTSEQKTAESRLKAVQKRCDVGNREFYDHIIEEARRRNDASRRWRDTRNKWFGVKVKNKR